MNAFQIFAFIMASTFMWAVAFSQTLGFVNRLLIISLTVAAMRMFVF